MIKFVAKALSDFWLLSDFSLDNFVEDGEEDFKATLDKILFDRHNRQEYYSEIRAFLWPCRTKVIFSLISHFHLMYNLQLDAAKLNFFVINFC